MDDTRARPNGGLIAAAIIVILLALLAAYLAAYFTVGAPGTAAMGPRPVRLHVYRYKWQAVLFRPAARVESLFAGEEVDTAYRTN